MDANNPALIRARDLPIWHGPVTPEPLAGGITNVNFVVADAGKRYVVRIGDDILVHQVMRFNELAASRAAEAAAIFVTIVPPNPSGIGTSVLPVASTVCLSPANSPAPAYICRSRSCAITIS